MLELVKRYFFKFIGKFLPCNNDNLFKGFKITASKIKLVNVPI